MGSNKYIWKDNNNRNIQDGYGSKSLFGVAREKQQNFNGNQA